MPRAAKTGSSCRYRSAGLWWPLSPRKRTLSGFGAWAWATAGATSKSPTSAGRRSIVVSPVVTCAVGVSLAIRGPDRGLELSHNYGLPDVALRIGPEQPDIQVRLRVQVRRMSDRKRAGPAGGQVLDCE